jgi:hypothetical protein
MQTLFWFIAAVSAVPFAIAGERFMTGLALVTLLLALATFLTGLGVLNRRRGARRNAIVLEVICLFGSALLLLAPIGFNGGLVSIMVNVLLPLAVIVLLRKDQEVFA